MKNAIIVGISDQKTGGASDVLVTYALGSCVGICLHDGVRKIGGLSHILLPEAFEKLDRTQVFKFADTAIEALVKTMELHGCQRSRLCAKIAGGANMFLTSGVSIGDRNVEAVKKVLDRLHIRIVASDVGKNYGRTIEFDPEDGKLLIKTAGKGTKTI